MRVKIPTFQEINSLRVKIPTFQEINSLHVRVKIPTFQEINSLMPKIALFAHHANLSRTCLHLRLVIQLNNVLAVSVHEFYEEAWTFVRSPMPSHSVSTHTHTHTHTLTHTHTHTHTHVGEIAIASLYKRTAV